MDYREIIENLTDEIVEKILDKLEIPWQDKGDFLLCKTACFSEKCSVNSKISFTKPTRAGEFMTSAETETIIP